MALTNYGKTGCRITLYMKEAISALVVNPALGRFYPISMNVKAAGGGRDRPTKSVACTPLTI